MKKLVPYVNLETVKNKDGQIESFIIHTVSYLPADSNVTLSGLGKVGDNVLYRPLSINYDGTSGKFDYFDEDFVIERNDVGLLERGAKVTVKAASAVMTKSSGSESTDDDDEGGTTVEYDDPIIP